MKIQNQNSFEQALRNGINLFVGSAFSIMAKDSKGRALPTGKGLLKELNEKFGTNQTDLTRLTTVLEHKKPQELKSYLIERFTVADVGSKIYDNINKIRLKYIFTANIDNLIPKIIDRSGMGYLHNMRTDGDSADPNAICYLPLHGNVDSPCDGLIFTSTQIATIFDNAPRLWSYLGTAVEKHPTLFIGYSYNDSSTINALANPRNTNTSAHKDKWILLKNPDEAGKDYFEALGFNIIESDTEEFLSALPKLVENNQLEGANNIILKLFKANLVPDSAKGLPVRSVIHFFQGMNPEWSDIINGNIYPVSHVSSVLNSILDRSRQTIVTGSPISGKSTIAMQAVYKSSGFSKKFFFNDITKEKALYLRKYLAGQNALILTENITNDIEAFKILSETKGLKIVGVARSIDLGIVSHELDSAKYDIFNVTEVTDRDFAEVYKTLPTDSRWPKLRIDKDNNLYKRDTIFEFVLKNIKGQSISERYQEILESADEEQVEFLVLCAYMHYCQIPLSIEVAASYFEDNYPYARISVLKSELDDLLKDLESSEFQEMDYYNPRSSHLADVIIEKSPKHILQNVLNGVIALVPQVQIPNYGSFKRRAFDHRLIGKAFPDWKSGEKFYESAFHYDYNNPYVLQQEALYLAGKGHFDEAFSKIDKAKVMTGDRHFSIRNSYAIILFEANIKKDFPETKRYLNESMNILEKCYNNDKRKFYHAEIYAEQAKRYYKKFQDSLGIDYLRMAQKWLENIDSNNPWSGKRQLLDSVKALLKHSETKNT